ncbi:hypothetical protein T484DRAFT_1877747 [Baffinella frigidus]|nr:hypothetical protein T484DRAFT_1877747 [Cryptophyta sp. CCMP2293]
MADEAAVDLTASLQNAIQGLGAAFMQFGQALQAVNVAASVKQQEAAKAGKKRKTKEEKDKNKKPRAPSAYNIFVAENSKKLWESGSYKDQKEVMSALGAKWKELTPGGKEPYTKQADAAKAQLVAGSSAAAVPQTPADQDSSSDDDDDSDGEPPAVKAKPTPSKPAPAQPDADKKKKGGRQEEEEVEEEG